MIQMALRLWIVPTSGLIEWWIDWVQPLVPSCYANDCALGDGPSQHHFQGLEPPSLPQTKFPSPSHTYPFCLPSSHSRTEAATSLETAAGSFLQSAGLRKPTHRKVVFEFTCELDTHCRKVLQKTYNKPCNWPDIIAFDSSKKHQYCSTHEKMCPVVKYTGKNRILTARILLKLFRMHHSNFPLPSVTSHMFWNQDWEYMQPVLSSEVSIQFKEFGSR